MSSTNTPAEIVQQAVAAFAERDAAALFRAVAPEIDVFASDLRSWGGRYQGIAEVHARLVALLADRDLEIRMERVVEMDHQIVTAGTARGMVKEMGLPFELPFACVWLVRRDAILGLEIYTGAAAADVFAAPDVVERRAGTRARGRG